EDADHERRQRWKYQRRHVATRTPHAVVEPRQRTVLHEVEALDHIDVRVSSCREIGIEPTATHRKRECTVSLRSPFLDSQQRHQYGEPPRADANPADDDSVLPGEGVLDRAADLTGVGSARGYEQRDNERKGQTKGERHGRGARGLT